MSRILVVDDEEDMRWTFTNLLENEGYTVESLADGPSAIQRIQKNDIDLVLLDIRIPNMDGIQILEKLKSIKNTLPVIVITGYGNPETAANVMKLGAFDYLSKPFDNNKLLNMVKRALELSKLKKGTTPFQQHLAQNLGLEEKSSSIEKEALVSVFKKKINKKAVLWKKITWGFVSVLIIGLVTYYFISGNFTWKDRTYPISYSHISGMCWGGEQYLWTADWFNQTLYKQKLNSTLEIIKSYYAMGKHFTGLAYGGTVLYTCDSWKRLIYKHNLDSDLTVIESYKSPGANPSGLFYDGKYLWSCDINAKKIYKHQCDSQLTIIETYDAPGTAPVGIYIDNDLLWSVDGETKYLYQHDLKNKLNVIAKYAIPAIKADGDIISAFTMNKNRIYIAIEGINTIFSYNIKKLERE